MYIYILYIHVYYLYMCIRFDWKPLSTGCFPTQKLGGLLGTLKLRFFTEEICPVFL